MPEIQINTEAVLHNLEVIRGLEHAWGFTLLPVLKMAAAHPGITALLHARGRPSYGVADVDEHLAHSSHAPDSEGRVLTNIPPLHRTDDVTRLFERSAFSRAEGFHAVDEAARRQGRKHAALLMVDLGDMREGVPAPEALALLRKVAPASRRACRENGARVIGLGVTMGCLYGTCPDEENMACLEDLASKAENALGHSLNMISLGGTVFWNWFAERKKTLLLPAGCALEFRMGDPLLLGYDMYRNLPLQGGDFRRDTFRLSATVLEVHDRDIRPPRHSVHNGHGLSVAPLLTGKRKRALIDCGSLHTDVAGLSLQMPGAEIVDFSGNYAILDVTDCPRPPLVGDHVHFLPSYWAVARACRVPQVIKTTYTARNT